MCNNNKDDYTQVRIDLCSYIIIVYTSCSIYNYSVQVDVY